MATQYSQYERTFTSFGGPDIVPIFNNKVIGECQAVTYSVRREKAEIFCRWRRRAGQISTVTGAF